MELKEIENLDLEMSIDHYPLRNIAGKLGRHPETINKLLKNFSIPIVVNTNCIHKDWVKKEDIDHLLSIKEEFFLTHYTLLECREIFNTNKNTLNKFLKRKGIETLVNPFDKTQKVVLRKHIDKLKKELDGFYKENIPIDETIKVLGLSSYLFNSFLEKHKITKLSPMINEFGRLWISKDAYYKAIEKEEFYNPVSKDNGTTNYRDLETNDFLETHYILARVREKLNISSPNIRRFLDRHNISTVPNPYHKGQFGVPKHYIDSILENLARKNFIIKKNNLMKVKDIFGADNKYYHIDEAQLILSQQLNIGKGNQSTKQILEEFNIQLHTPFSIESQIGVLKSDIDNLVSNIKYNYLSVGEIDSLYNGELELSTQAIRNILTSKVFEPKESNHILGKLFFKKDLISRVFSSNKKYLTPFEMVRKISKETNKPPKSLEKIEKLIELGELQKLFKDSLEPETENGSWLFSKRELEVYIGKYYSICKKYILGREGLKEYFKIDNLSYYIPIDNIKAPTFFTDLFYPTGRSIILYDKDDAARFLLNPRYLTILNGAYYQGPIDLIKDIIDSFNKNTNIIDTLILFKGQIEENFPSSERYETIIQGIRDFSEVAKVMIKYMNKELVNLNTAELLILMESFPTKNLKYTFWLFARSVEKKRLTRYTTNQIPLPLNESVTPKEKVVIELDEMLQVYQYCKDINLHISYSVEDKIHSQLWLVTMVLLTNAWRMPDIYRIPIIDPKAFGIPNINWFLNNTIDLYTAQKVINLIRSYKLVVSKTGQPRDFTCNKELAIPLVTAIFICAFHNIESNNLNLIDFRTESRKYNRVYSFDFSNFFSKSSKIKVDKFSAQIANRSLLEHLYYAILERNEQNESYSAFELMMKLRSNLSPDATSVYIRERNQLLLELFDRGVFGYVYDQILDLLAPSGKPAFKERTKQIEAVRKDFNPLQIEQLSKFINQVSLFEEEVRLITALMALNPDEFFEYNRKIFLGEMPSKDPNIQCMAYPNCYRTSSRFSCHSCDFAVHNVYSSIYIFEELNSSIEIFEKSKKVGIKKREAKIIYKLLDLLEHAIQKHGEEYVFSFCDNEQDLMDSIIRSSPIIDRLLSDEVMLNG